MCMRKKIYRFIFVPEQFQPIPMKEERLGDIQEDLAEQVDEPGTVLFS